MQDFGPVRPFSLPGKKGGLPLLPNGAIDLYALLELPPTASAEALRQRIGELYSQALANTEHRDIGRRHYFENLLEFLPRCHEILLDPVHRHNYDAYLLVAKEDPGVEPFVLQPVAVLVDDTQLPEANLLDIRTPDPEVFEAPQPDPAPLDVTSPEFHSAFSTGAALAGLTAGLATLVALRAGLLWSTAAASMGGLAVAALIAFLLSRKRRLSSDQPK